MKKLLMILVALVLILFMVPVMAEAVEPPPVPLFRIDLTPMFQAFIALLASLVTLKLIPWIKARTTEKQQDLLRAAVSVAVYAAEQIYGAGNGTEKFNYVKGQLQAKGYDINVMEIEAAVRDLVTAGADYHPAVEPTQNE